MLTGMATTNRRSISVRRSHRFRSAPFGSFAFAACGPTHLRGVCESRKAWHSNQGPCSLCRRGSRPTGNTVFRPRRVPAVGGISPSGCTVVRRDARGVEHLPDVLHFRYVRESWPDWYPGLSEAAARESLFQEAERLRHWYQNMLDSEPPYLEAARGYVAAYMPRGYYWFAGVVEDVEDEGCLRRLVQRARSVLVLGCGPAPELWSLARYLGREVVVTLMDRNMLVWERFIRGFTVPLVVEARGGLFAAEVPRLEFRLGGHDSVIGVRRFDLVLAQQVLNEVAALRATPYRGRQTVSTAVSDWRRRLLRRDGAIVVVDNDPDDRRLPAIEERLPPGTCRGRVGAVRCPRALLDLQGISSVG